MAKSKRKRRKEARNRKEAKKDPYCGRHFYPGTPADVIPYLSEYLIRFPDLIPGIALFIGNYEIGYWFEQVRPAS